LQHLTIADRGSAPAIQIVGNGTGLKQFACDHPPIARFLVEGGFFCLGPWHDTNIQEGIAPSQAELTAGGLTPRELFPLLRRLCAETNVVGMELVELNPLVDPTYVTPLVANRCVREMLTGVAMRKKGLTEKHYLNPDTVDHGQG